MANNLEIINKLLGDQTKSIPNEVKWSEIQSTLLHVSNTILEKKSFKKNTSIVRLSICISSYAMDPRENYFKTAFSYFRLIEKFPDLPVLQFKLATLQTYDKLVQDLNVNFLETLSPKIKDKCDKYLVETNPIKLTNFKNKFENLKKQISLFAINPGLNDSLQTAFSFLYKKAGQNNTSASIAAKALGYLCEEHDIIPDNLGIFGIADDVYVLESVANELGGLNYGEELHLELKTMINSQEQIFVSDNDFLRPLNKQLQLLLTKIKFLSQKEGRYVFVLPDTGPTALLYFISLIVDFTNDEANQNILTEEDIEVGSKIYFKIDGGFFEVLYMGVQKVHDQEYVKLKFESDKGKPSYFYNKNILTYALKDIHENSNILRRKENFEINFLNDGYIPHKVKQRSVDLSSNIFLTNKFKLEKNIDEISPFGTHYTNLISFEYIKLKRNGTIGEEMIGNSSNRIKTFSDASVAREFFLNEMGNHNNINVICDSSELGTRFLEELSELDLRKISKCLFFYPHNQKNHLNVCQEKSFNFCYPGKAFVDMGRPRVYSKSSNVIKNYEDLLYSSYLTPDIISENITSNHIDNLHNYSKKMSRVTKNLGNFLLSYQINYISDKLLQNIFGFNTDEINLVTEKVDQLIYSLEYIDDEIADQFKSYLIENKDTLLHLNKERDFINFVSKHSSKNPAILARTFVEKKEIETLLMSVGLANIDVIYLQTGFIKINDKVLLVPVMPSTKLVNILNQIKISKNVILNFTKNEYQFFRRLNNKTTRWNLLLENLNKKTFAGSKVATKKTIGKAEEKIIQFVENEEEEEIQQMVKEKFQLKQDKSFSVSNIRESILAKAFSVKDTSNILFLPPNSDIISYDINTNKFVEIEVDTIQNDTIVLVRSDNSGDPYEEIAFIVDHNYGNKKARSGVWKKILKNYLLSNQLSVEELTSRLALLNVKRHPNTIKGWLEKATTIAPKYPEKTLEAILKLTNTKSPSVSQIITARDDVMQTRRNAANRLMSYLPELTYDEILEKSSIDIKFSNSNLSMKIIHIENYVDELEINPNQVWKLESLES